MTENDREPVEELFQRFMQASAACPQRPPRFEESKPLAEHGSVKARLDTCTGRQSDIETEWRLLVQEHTSIHQAGVTHLKHLMETIVDLESSGDSDPDRDT